MKTFGDWLKAKRTELHISGVELERRTGVSRQYISNLERNLRSDFTNQIVQPSVEKVDALAKGLGVSVDEARLAAGYAPEHSEPIPPQIRAVGFDGISETDLEMLADLMARLKRTPQT